MTIAAAFPCKDGLVFCADTQETISGYVKTDTEKNRVCQTPTYNIVFTGAGDADLIEMTSDEIIKRLLQGSASAVVDIENVIKESLREVFNNSIVPYNSYAYEERPVVPHILIGLQYEAATLLYRANGTKLRMMREPECVGMGLALAKSLMGQLLTVDISLARAGLVAVYVLQQAKRWIDGCGGNSDVLLLSHREKKITRMPTNEIQKLENHFSMFNDALREVLLATADSSIAYSNYAQVIKQFEVNMLSLRGQFMDMEEFMIRLYLLTGNPLPPELEEKAKKLSIQY